MEGAFYVEDIWSKRKFDGKEEYYIKWDGYDVEENTWEPKNQLKFCPEAIDEFDRRWEDMYGPEAYNSEHDFRQMPRRKYEEKRKYNELYYPALNEIPTKLCKREEIVKRQPSTMRPMIKPVVAVPQLMNGFENGRKIEKIYGLQEVDGVKFAVVTWKDSSTREYVPIDELKKHASDTYLQYIREWIEGKPEPPPKPTTTEKGSISKPKHKRKKPTKVPAVKPAYVRKESPKFGPSGRPIRKVRKC